MSSIDPGGSAKTVVELVVIVGKGVSVELSFVPVVFLLLQVNAFLHLSSAETI